MSKLCECHKGYAYQHKNWGKLETGEWVEASLNSFANSHYECCYFEQLSIHDKAKIIREYKRVLAFELKKLATKASATK